MKTTILTTFLILLGLSINAQTTNTNPNSFLNFEEFQKNEPTLTFEFQLKQRTTGDIFMTGGIANYRLKRIKPKSVVENVEKIIWGVKVGDSIYINSYPYSRRIGYNVILEKGYYTYFIGEPAWDELEQKELGIIEATSKKVQVWGRVGYVILPDGTVKFLKPELLLELCKDNEEMVTAIKNANLRIENVYEMFDFLKRYNKTKK